MSIATFSQSLLLGWERRWKRGLASSFIVLGTIWTLTELSTRTLPGVNTWLNDHGRLYLCFAVLCAATSYLITAFEARCVRFTIPGTDVRLTLKFGDLFKEDADWLVGVNEFFDSELGPLVSPDSIHGQIVTREYGGNGARFRAELDQALSKHNGKATARGQGQTTRYDLGTTAVLHRSSKHLYLVAIAKTNLQTNRASTTVPILWDALGEALKTIDNTGNGQPLAMPLIGNGRASVPVPPQHLLRLITLIIMEAAKRHGLPKSITIALADDCFEHLDLHEIKRGWSFG
jgi:hypothetical protein